MKNQMMIATVLAAALGTQPARGHAGELRTSPNPTVESSASSRSVVRSAIGAGQTVAYSIFLYSGQSVEVEGWGLGTSDLDMQAFGPAGEATADASFGDSFFGVIFARYTGTYTIYITNDMAGANQFTMVLTPY